MPKQSTDTWFNVHISSPIDEPMITVDADTRHLWSTVSDGADASAAPSDKIKRAKKPPSEEQIRAKAERLVAKKVAEEKALADALSSQKKKRKQSTAAKPKGPKKPTAERARKIRLLPSIEQKKILNQWFGTARWTYNQCLAYWKETGFINKKLHRLKLVNNELYAETDKQWVLETPYNIRDEAMNDFLKAVATNLRRAEPFEMKFRSKKHRQVESIVIHHKYWKDGSMYPTLFGRGRLKSAHPIPPELGYDSRLLRTRLGKFYLVVSKPMVVRSETQAPETSHVHSGVVSIDPGVRTFLTCYDPSGKIIEWGVGDMSRIHRLCRHLNKLISKRTTYRGPKRSRKRCSMKRAEYRVRDRVRNLIDDCHWRAIRFLTSNYRVIILPHFNTPQMAKRGARSIGRDTVKGMLNWGHGRFRSRLVEKARECPWLKVIISTEEFTSKTCGKCGQRYNIGSDKVYKCRNRECQMKMDRDWNGARNILLKYLTERRLVA